MDLQVWPGHPYPLGATWDGAGVNFALYSTRATAVTLCLFDHADKHETARIPLVEHTDQVWHGYVPTLQPGQLYGYRVEGPFDPQAGLRFNPSKLLVDPYARAVTGGVVWDDALFGYQIGHEEQDLSTDTRDSAAYMPKGIVIDPAFDWGEEHPPHTPLHRSVVYEVHVKGFTIRHPGVPEALRGTYAGLATPAVLEHLTSLGVTAVELLPVHFKVNDRHLVERGLSNYWGYNTLGYFAPDPRYAAADHPAEVVREFKAMVKTLHAARDRGHPGCGVQPHGGGQPSRPHPELQGGGQPLLLPPGER